MIKLEELKPGDIVVADGGFTCMKAGDKVVQEKDGELFVSCDEGQHYLGAQKNDVGVLIGLTKKKET